MTRTEGASACPQAVLDWIAWYPDGDLPSDVRGAIEVHAAECAACRQEIADLAATDGGEAQPSAGAERTFSRVLDRIAAQAPRSAPPVQRRWVVRPRFAVAAGLAVALLSATAGVIATRILDRGATRYETATARDGGSPASAPHLDVVFRGDVPFSEVALALRAIGAVIESGPSQGRVVRLRLSPGSDAAAAARRLESGDLDVADFAQPAP